LKKLVDKGKGKQRLTYIAICGVTCVSVRQDDFCIVSLAVLCVLTGDGNVSMPENPPGWKALTKINVRQGVAVFWLVRSQHVRQDFELHLAKLAIPLDVIHAMVITALSGLSHTALQMNGALFMLLAFLDSLTNSVKLVRAINAHVVIDVVGNEGVDRLPVRRARIPGIVTFHFSPVLWTKAAVFRDSFPEGEGVSDRSHRCNHGQAENEWKKSDHLAFKNVFRSDLKL
jgi:hypothetical protein